MVAAVTQLAVVDIGPLVALAGLFLHPGDLLALCLGLLDLVLEDGDYVAVDAEIVVQFAGHEVIDIGTDCRAAVYVPGPGFCTFLPFSSVLYFSHM